MAKKNKTLRTRANNAPVNPPEKKAFRGVTIVVAVLGLVGTVGGTLGGMLLQDHLDLLRTQRQLVLTYSNDAEDSEKSVETIVRSLAGDLTNPNARITTDQRLALRGALLDLRSDIEKLSVQIGSVEVQYQSYARAMANLADALDQTDGAGGVDVFVEALNSFYLRQRQFKSDISAMHRPSST